MKVVKHLGTKNYYIKDGWLYFSGFIDGLFPKWRGWNESKPFPNKETAEAQVCLLER